MSVHIERARLLLHQHNPGKAIESLQQALSYEPENVEVYYLLSLAYNNQKKFDEALKTAEIAISKHPESPGPHYALALAFYNMGDLKKSETALTESLRLDVSDPDYYELLGLIHIGNKKWKEALEYARKGLEFNPDHHGCIDVQAQALTKLKRGDEASSSLQTALSRNPHNPALHERMGWSLLEKGEHQEAMTYFVEAARLNPQSTTAKQGILTSLKAKNFFYAFFLRYAFFMARLDSRTQWLILIGGVLAVRFGRSLLESAGFPEAAWVLMGLWLAAVFFTWAGDSIFNLLLRLHPQGKHALSQAQINGANLCGIIMLYASILIAGSFITRLPGLLILGLSTFLLIIPGSLIYTLRRKSSKIQVSAFTGILALAEIYGLISGTVFQNWDMTINIALFVFIATILFSWYANFLAMKEK